MADKPANDCRRDVYAADIYRFCTRDAHAYIDAKRDQRHSIIYSGWHRSMADAGPGCQQWSVFARSNQRWGIYARRYLVADKPANDCRRDIHAADICWLCLGSAHAYSDPGRHELDFGGDGNLELYDHYAVRFERE